MRPRASGFTLVEALVAVTLLALLFGALMPLFQQGLAVLRSGDRHTRAVLLAQSVLDSQLALAAGTAQPSAQQLSTQGELEDFRWQVSRAPFQAGPGDLPGDETGPGAGPDAGPDADPGTNPFVLTQISVVVRWPENESGVQLHTLVIEAAQ